LASLPKFFCFLFLDSPNIGFLRLNFNFLSFCSPVFCRLQLLNRFQTNYLQHFENLQPANCLPNFCCDFIFKFFGLFLVLFTSCVSRSPFVLLNFVVKKFGFGPRFEGPKFASLKFASPKFVSPKFASLKFASPKFASPKFAGPKFAGPKFAGSKFAFSRSRFFLPLSQHFFVLRYFAPQFLLLCYSTSIFQMNRFGRYFLFLRHQFAAIEEIHSSSRILDFLKWF
jgi:hypothetical protein